MKTISQSGFGFLFVCLGVMAVAEEPKLPEPPEGFKWERFPEMKAAFLCPAGWFVRRRDERGTAAGYLTKEDTIKEGSFLTGITINYIQKVSEKADKKPSEYAAAYAKVATSEKKTLLPVSARDIGRLKSVIFRVEGDDTIVHFLMVADDKFDTVHLIMFESPAKEWDEAWKKGEVILQKISFQFPT